VKTVQLYPEDSKQLNKYGRLILGFAVFSRLDARVSNETNALFKSRLRPGCLPVV
jgi:hypothetical protein